MLWEIVIVRSIPDIHFSVFTPSAAICELQHLASSRSMTPIHCYNCSVICQLCPYLMKLDKAIKPSTTHGWNGDVGYLRKYSETSKMVSVQIEVVVFSNCPLLVVLISCVLTFRESKIQV